MTSPGSNGEPRVEASSLPTAPPYAVKLPLFEGPLELLLHLIRLNEVEITDIPIARIGEQYLEYIELMHDLTTERAQSIVQTVAPGYRLVSVTPAFGSFTNDVRILECQTSKGNADRLVVKFMVDEPEFAAQCAKAEFHALMLVRAHGVPAPEPIYLDETGGVLGVPGVVTRFVEGRQVANPQDVTKWAEALAQQLHNIDIGPFIVTTNIVGFAHLAILQHQINTPAVIFDVQPVPDIQAVAING